MSYQCVYSERNTVTFYTYPLNRNDLTDTTNNKMIQYPLNYLKDLKCGTHKVQISLYEYEALRAIQWLTKVEVQPRQFDFIVVYDLKTGIATVDIKKENYAQWEKLPANTVLSVGLVADAAARSIETGEPVWLAVDDEKEYGKIRTYVSRSKADVMCRRNGPHVMISPRLAGSEGPIQIHIGIEKGYHSFMATGSEAYVRQRVSALNKESNVQYSVKKISTGSFCVIRRTTRDDSKVEAMYRTFLAVPSRANADALIEVVRGMVESEQR